MAGAKKLPKYLIVSPSNDHKEDLKPEKRTRAVPKWLKKVLLGIPPTIADAAEATQKTDSIELLCYLDKVNIRIKRGIFKSNDAFKYLKLGTCPVNHRDNEYYFLLYSLTTDCGFHLESLPDYSSISIALKYNPTSPVIRDMPFEILLQCRYPRLFYSYTVGFHPELQGGTFHKVLQPNSSFSISSQDALGNEIPGSETYILGHPMYFEASGPDKTTDSADEKIYINKCFVTASRDPTSQPKYTVIDNHGCMIDGKVTIQSKFLLGNSTSTQKFSVGSFIFKDGTSTTSPQVQFYIHCEMSLGPLTPTSSSKACNYDHATYKWRELHGRDCVCACCDSTCPSAHPKMASKEIITSKSWKVDFSSEGEFEEVDPQFNSFDAETVNVEDPNMEGHTYFLNCD
ncbi:zona pellucida sperm-binding protein 3 [Cololabis saira]|uniref:zona pellucida sperm-binding protein 3 n=1 Tax=Cololabis saira TaxID=129043 RepID=UPI002AD2D5A0|nr:zona pellucida sperm-binding protein 3 [Cololabis saira]